MRPEELPLQHRIKSISLFDNGEVESVEYYEERKLLPGGRPVPAGDPPPRQLDL